ncbi:MAG: DUF4097 family beta strand repeat-containing protein [Bacillota bacterium]
MDGMNSETRVSQSRSYQVTTPCHVRLKQLAGTTEVRAWDRPAVSVEAVAYGYGRSEAAAAADAKGWTLEEKVKPSVVTLKVRPRLNPLPHGCVDLVVHVPARASLEIDTVSGNTQVIGVRGSVRVDGASGEVDLEGCSGDAAIDTAVGTVTVRGHRGTLYIDTGSGRVAVTDHRGRLRVDTAGGQVDVMDVAGDVWVDGGNGKVSLHRCAGEVNVDTAGGGIILAECPASQVQLGTQSGTIDAGFSPCQQGQYECRTATGDIDVRLDPGASAELAVFADRGSVNCSVPLREAVRRPSEYRGRLGGGRAGIKLTTRTGAVRMGFLPVNASPGRGKAPDEATQVLKLLAEGRIDAEQAEALLSAIRGEPAHEPGAGPAAAAPAEDPTALAAAPERADAPHGDYPASDSARTEASTDGSRQATEEGEPA